MDWALRLAEAAGWQQSAAEPCDWDAVERKIGVALPTDFKHFCDVFGEGEFDGWLSILAAEIPRELAMLRTSSLYEPHQLLTDGVGLIPWGCSEQGDRFYLLADRGSADRWPVIAEEDDGRWRRYAMTVSEFCWRLLTEDGFDFGIAEFGPPDFTPTTPDE